MSWIKEHCFFNPKLYDIVNKHFQRGQLRLISKGVSLNDYAKDLYTLPDNVAIDLVPNPVPINEEQEADRCQKDDLIVFLGRLESQKRVWLFCEVARRLPQYKFVVIGKLHRYRDENIASIEQYTAGKVPNLQFAGHLEGEEKYDYLRRAKILLNTSIWEGIPLSFLEALSVGTLIVSNVNPDNLPARFGIHVGEVKGDGFDKIGSFVSAVEGLMRDDERRRRLVQAAVAYIKENHSAGAFQKNMHRLLREEAMLQRKKKSEYLLGLRRPRFRGAARGKL
jgi:glycosyltransferase involved in cell wall biosynthesis